jgi:hypothetical protein
MRRDVPMWPAVLAAWTAGCIALFAFVLLPSLRAASKPQPVEGYSSGDVRQAPLPGTWTATGVYTMSRGYNGRGVGAKIQRPWSIEGRCDTQTCNLTITRVRSELAPQTAPLVRRSDGWHAVFPLTELTCGGTPERPVTWMQRDEVVLRFTHGGRLAEGRERKFSRAEQCGYGKSALDWTARLVAAG